VHGKFEGFGEFIGHNGVIYKGEYKAGLKEGKGFFQNEKGEKYEGTFKKDLKDGYGVYKWPSGNQYKGEYKNGIREGYGEMYWIDGSYYKGEWKEGVQNGLGEMFSIGEKYLKGIFRNNVLIEGEEIDAKNGSEIKYSKPLEGDSKKSTPLLKKKLPFNPALSTIEKMIQAEKTFSKATQNIIPLNRQSLPPLRTENKGKYSEKYSILLGPNQKKFEKNLAKPKSPYILK